MQHEHDVLLQENQPIWEAIRTGFKIMENTYAGCARHKQPNVIFNVIVFQKHTSKGAPKNEENLSKHLHWETNESHWIPCYWIACANNRWLNHRQQKYFLSWINNQRGCQEITPYYGEAQQNYSEHDLLIWSLFSLCNLECCKRFLSLEHCFPMCSAQG